MNGFRIATQAINSGTQVVVSTAQAASAGGEIVNAVKGIGVEKLGEVTVGSLVKFLAIAGALLMIVDCWKSWTTVNPVRAQCIDSIKRLQKNVEDL